MRIFIFVIAVLLPLLIAIPSSLAIQYMKSSVWITNENPTTNDILEIRGVLHDANDMPIQDAKIRAEFSDQVAYSTTNSTGSFVLHAIKSEPAGEYLVSYIISKEGFEDSRGMRYYMVIQANKTSIPTGHKVISNPLERQLLMQIEMTKNKQNQTDPQIQKTKAQTRFVEEKTSQTLEDDIARMDKQYEFFSPDNAFSRFVQNFDSVLRSVFLDSFSFTKQKHDAGHQAKIDALNDGKSSYEAMKEFHKSAASSRDEIIKLNHNLNIKYGLDNNTSQEKLSDLDKASRNSTR